VSVPMILIKRRDAMGQNFPADHRNYARARLTWNDQIWQGNIYREERISRGQPRSQPKRTRPQRPPNSSEPGTCVHTVLETVTKFCTVIKLDMRKIFAVSITPPCPGQKLFSVTNANARSVCNS